MDQVFFVFDDIANDEITAINGVSLITPQSVKDFVTDNSRWGDWWVQPDARGKLVLTTNCEELTNMTLTADNGSPYIIQAQCDFVGGRPSRPIAR